MVILKIARFYLGTIPLRDLCQCGGISRGIALIIARSDYTKSRCGELAFRSATVTIQLMLVQYIVSIQRFSLVCILFVMSYWEQYYQHSRGTLYSHCGQQTQLCWGLQFDSPPPSWYQQKTTVIHGDQFTLSR